VLLHNSHSFSGSCIERKLSELFSSFNVVCLSGPAAAHMKVEGVEILISPSDVSAYTVAHQYLPTRILFEIEGAGLKDQRLEPLCAKRLASQA